MFGKKKNPAMDQQAANLKINQLFEQLAMLLYQDVAGANLGSAVHGLLEFDAVQRVTSMTNVSVNDAPKVPSFEVIEKMNALTVPTFQSLPDLYKLKSLELLVTPEGAFNAAPNYLN